jgi:glycopeptide antibiotics resistance protein
MLVAILFCALAPSPVMREVIWIPTWLADWADRNGSFRNFPVFAVFAALLFVVATFDQQLVSRYGRWRLAFGAFIVTALLGFALEALQLLLPGRWADPMDVFWSALGALTGAVAAAVFAVVLAPSA